MPSTTSKTVPVPRLHGTGALVATEKLAEWWLDPKHVEGRLEAIVAGKDLQIPGGNTVRGGEQGLRELNQAWLQAARSYLARFVDPISRRGGDTYRTVLNDRGLMFEAMERIRDGRIIEASIEGLDEGTQAGLDNGHQDVLAALALLARLDRTGEPGELKLRTEAFEPAE